MSDTIDPSMDKHHDRSILTHESQDLPAPEAPPQASVAPNIEAHDDDQPQESILDSQENNGHGSDSEQNNAHPSSEPIIIIQNSFPGLDDATAEALSQLSALEQSYDQKGSEQHASSQIEHLPKLQHDLSNLMQLLEVDMPPNFDDLLNHIGQMQSKPSESTRSRLASDHPGSIKPKLRSRSSNAESSQRIHASLPRLMDQSDDRGSRAQAINMVSWLTKAQRAIQWIMSLSRILKWIFLIIVGLTIVWLITGILSWLGLWSYLFVVGSSQTSSPNIVVDVKQHAGWTDTLVGSWTMSKPTSRVPASQAMYDYMKHLIDDYTSGRIGKSKIKPGAQESCYKMLEAGRFAILPQIHQQLTILDICTFDHKQDFLSKAQQYFASIYPHEYQKFVQLVESHWDASQE